MEDSTLQPLCAALRALHQLDSFDISGVDCCGRHTLAICDALTAERGDVHVEVNIVCIVSEGDYSDNGPYTDEDSVCVAVERKAQQLELFVKDVVLHCFF